MAQRTFDDFDKHANEYREIHTQNVKLTGGDSFYFVNQKVLILKENENSNNLQMLDVGCGDGETEVFIQKHLPGWKVNAIDVSAASVKTANEKNIANTSFQLFNGTDIPFTDNRFDVVFIASVLHHVDFSLHGVMMKEIYRVLKPEGRLYLFEHNPLNPFTQYLVNTCDFDKDAKLLFHWYCKKVLKKTGFISVKIKFILFFPRQGFWGKLKGVENALSWLPLGGQYFFKCTK